MSNNNLFYSQLAISILGLSITSSLLFIDRENQNIFLPIFTSIIFAWIPSPITVPNNKVDDNLKKVSINDILSQQQKKVADIPKEINIV